MTTRRRNPAPAVIPSPPASSKEGRTASTAGSSWLPQLVKSASTKKYHDIFNMVMLPLLLILGIDKLVRESDTTFQPKVVLGYFVVDILWVLVDPGCVRSPGEILLHHVAVVMGALISLSVPELENMWSRAIFIEVNTVFLVAQRAIPEGTARLVLRVITVLSWIPCRFFTSAYFAHKIYLGYTEQFLSMPQIVLGSVMFIIIFGMQIMWTQRLVAGRLIDEVLRSTLGIEWRKGTSTSNEKFVNEGL
uniref:TLC domain-containing protein n=2 Tax=Cafeteria roenbergensis TaxID=33653 RepID=A0A7S0JNV9_CAFRO|mmetsp:Transcript_1163/g.4486  ORF Transcript_1163/g.4486 Transcript_1163/m.4486 type:complete len:248 (+) Transcript_1163:216-959(+)